MILNSRKGGKLGFLSLDVLAVFFLEKFGWFFLCILKLLEMAKFGKIKFRLG